MVPKPRPKLVRSFANKIENIRRVCERDISRPTDRLLDAVPDLPDDDLQDSAMEVFTRLKEKIAELADVLAEAEKPFQGGREGGTSL
jgi:hypothetical protein